MFVRYTVSNWIKLLNKSIVKTTFVDTPPKFNSETPVRGELSVAAEL